MKKIALIFSLAIIFMSCENKDVKIDSIPTSPMAHETGVSIEVKEKGEFSNPSFVAGSTFGEFFVSMLRTQNYDMALRFTSKGSKEKFGNESILKRYKSYDYNYSLKLKSVVQVSDTFNLLYTTNEYATGKMKKMTVVVENDTCKLVFQDKNSEILK